MKINKKSFFSLMVITAMLISINFAQSTQATHVEPEKNPNNNGNATCADAGYGSFSTSGNINDPENSDSILASGGTISWTHDDTYLDWSSSGVTVLAVIIKGGPNANAYHYNPPTTTSDTGLHSPGHPNPDKIPEISHIVFCYKESLQISKTADTSFTRTYEWEIEKSAGGEEAVNDLGILESGDTKTVDYTVTVDAESQDSNWTVFGTITIYNPASTNATIESIEDALNISGTLDENDIDCGVELPYNLPSGETLECEYSVSVEGIDDTLNTVIVETSGDVEGNSATADVIWGEPTTEIDKCVNIYDDNGNQEEEPVLLGEICAPEIDDEINNNVFTYSLDFGNQAEGVDVELVCGQNTHANNAWIESQDEGNEQLGEDSWIINATVECVQSCSFSQGYWFASPQSDWGDGLVLEEHTYTKEDGQEIWKSSNKGGIADAKKAFTQYVALILSLGSNIPSELVDDVNLIESYFTTTLTDKFDGTNGVKKDKNLSEAASNISSWIENNHCE